MSCDLHVLETANHLEMRAYHYVFYFPCDKAFSLVSPVESSILIIILLNVMILYVKNGSTILRISILSTNRTGEFVFSQETKESSHPQPQEYRGDFENGKFNGYGDMR